MKGAKGLSPFFVLAYTTSYIGWRFSNYHPEHDRSRCGESIPSIVSMRSTSQNQCIIPCEYVLRMVVSEVDFGWSANRYTTSFSIPCFDKIRCCWRCQLYCVQQLNYDQSLPIVSSTHTARLPVSLAIC